MRATLLLAIATLAIADTKLPPPANFKIDFEKHVQPILAEKCHSCHGDEVRQSGLRLDQRQAALRGGDYGPVIIPGNSADSKLIRRVVNGDGGLQMPPSGPLSTEEIGILRAWIDQGVEFRIQVKEEPAPKPIDPKLAALISAVRAGDTKTVAKLVSSSPALAKGQDTARATPLHHAAGFGNLATMKLLLDNGADVNAPNRRKSTPIFWAIHEAAKVRLLIERGASLNIRQADGRTPVYQAASIGNGASVLRLLLEKGANPDTATDAGMTPLMAAATRANLPAMELLIQKNANIHARNAAGANALIPAAATGNPQAVRMLLNKGVDPNAITKRKESALAAAATAGVEETFKILIESGAKVDVADDRGYTPLMYAAAADAVPVGIVKMLLARGADPKATGEGETARTLAAKRGDTEIARALGISEAERKAAEGTSAEKKSDRSVPERIQSALKLLALQSHNFIRIGGCNSCHAQDLPSAAAAIARNRGLTAPEVIPQLPQSMHTVNPERIMDLGANSVGGLGWEMFDFGNNRAPANEYTDAAVRYVKSMQTAAGNWQASEGRRPPVNTGEVQTAALAIYTLKTYSRPAEKADTDKVIARAAAWLESVRPVSTQDKAFQLMGLSWANASSAAVAASAKALVATQRADGGWSQLPTMGSDAYATGQALYALHTGKMPVSDAAYQKGVKYLLGSQAVDGAWHVKSRSIWIQPYFESGFPYGHDQWISAAGTSWAVMALSMTVEPQRLSRNVRPY